MHICTHYITLATKSLVSVHNSTIALLSPCLLSTPPFPADNYRSAVCLCQLATCGFVFVFRFHIGTESYIWSLCGCEVFHHPTCTRQTPDQSRRGKAHSLWRRSTSPPWHPHRGRDIRWLSSSHITEQRAPESAWWFFSSMATTHSWKSGKCPNPLEFLPWTATRKLKQNEVSLDASSACSCYLVPFRWSSGKRRVDIPTKDYLYKGWCVYLSCMYFKWLDFFPDNLSSTSIK